MKHRNRRPNSVAPKQASFIEPSQAAAANAPDDATLDASVDANAAGAAPVAGVVDAADAIAPAIVAAADDARASAASDADGGSDPAAVAAAAVDDAPVMDPPADAPAGPTVGEKLRAAREAKGLTREDVARATHLSSAVIADIEADNYVRAGAPIYVRGHLRAYARIVGVADGDLVVATPAREAESLALMPSHGARARVDLISKYWNPLAYAALTAVVIVPVWFLLQPLLVTGTRAPDLSPIDAPRAELLGVPSGGEAVARAPVVPVASPADIGPPMELAGPALPASEVRETDGIVALDPAQRPVMASMAPIPESSAPGTARHVKLRLTADSWVEFVGADGRKLEFALLPAGTDREYSLNGKADLRIGNVRGATLAIDGRTVDLASFARANVARITIGDDANAQ